MLLKAPNINRQKLAHIFSVVMEDLHHSITNNKISIQYIVCAFLHFGSNIQGDGEVEVTYTPAWAQI